MTSLTYNQRFSSSFELLNLCSLSVTFFLFVVQILHNDGSFRRKTNVNRINGNRFTTNFILRNLNQTLSYHFVAIQSIKVKVIADQWHLRKEALLVAYQIKWHFNIWKKNKMVNSFFEAYRQHNLKFKPLVISQK